MIELSAVTKHYGAVRVLDRVTTTIEPGGVVALIGANGAGKSTLLSAIGRLLDIDSGSIRVDGIDVSAAAGSELARRLAVLRQDNHLPVRLTVRELVEFGRYPHAGTRLTATDHDRVDWALDRLELTSFGGRRLDQLSGGQRQRAFIAMVLAQDTDFVLLDEPLNNLDMRHAVETMDLVRQLADDDDKTIVIVLHDVNVAAGYADRIVALSDGVIVADGPPGRVLDRTTIAAVYDIDLPIHDVAGRPVVASFHPRPTTDSPRHLTTNRRPR